MSAYYNEIDHKTAAWLRELIKQGHIADGEVDERSIVDVKPEELRGFVQCHFFAGIGVWSHALRKAGWSDDRPVWTGSCPCQSFSAAGEGAGFDDPRHLWPHFFRLIRECRPPVVFGEQVEAAINHGWLDLVQDDLEGEDYAFGAVCFPAASVGAPHIRQRLYFVGDADYTGSHGWVLLPERTIRFTTRPSSMATFWSDCEWVPGLDEKARAAEPGTFPLVDGSAARVGRLRGYGNAIVSPQAQAFIEAYLET